MMLGTTNIKYVFLLNSSPALPVPIH